MKLRELLRQPGVATPALLLAVILLLTIVGPWFAPQPFDAIDFEADWGRGPSWAHPFGTDELGRDLFARVCIGGRLSLAVGLVSTLVALLIGIAWGAVAGYLGGRIDALMMRIVDILYALPFMFFVILLMVLFGRHWLLIFVAIGAVNWLDMARIVRGQTLALRRREFIDAAVISGLGPAAIIRLHIVPNLIGVVIVCATLSIPQAILVESFLSFLGLGIQEPATSWGALVNDGARAMEVTPWGLIFPAGFLALTLLCFNQLGDALREVFDGGALRRTRG
ncbi:ABC transporter permease [uncultured Nevskia sp.]|uniref:ABC transporter permease n=1 Tax=uncultured Nevskia sp. TaxID=228950 RepID=UPI0025DF681D|nr:ABC transporter permease subunit [uncultured Nevskia sp.]